MTFVVFLFLVGIILILAFCYNYVWNIDKKDKVISLLESVILFFALFFFLAGFLLQYSLNQLEGLGEEDYDKIGPYGDYIGGMLNPLIALFAVVAAGFAFYAQYQANKQVQEQFKLQKFESQFYEMLRLHKENVNEIQIEVIDFRKISTIVAELAPPPYKLELKSIRGRDAFIYFSNELEIAFNIYKKGLRKKSFDFSFPYKAFFNGLDSFEKKSVFSKKLESEKNNFVNEYLITKNFNKFNNVEVKSTYELFEGHENKLGHYYRHLFHTVKFVVEQETDLISYSKKRGYLRLLRAQLSNYEQAMLFYNYLAYAEEWETGNKYLTDYRMIHNLYKEVLIQDKYFEEEYDKLKGKQDVVKTYKKDDHIFESQKWD